MHDDDMFEDESNDDSSQSDQCLPIEPLVKKAAISKQDEDVEKLFSSLKGRRLYLKTRDDDGDQIPIVTVNGSLSAFVLYTSNDDQRLNTIYGGTKWENALNMLLHMKTVEGLIIQSATTNAYVCVTKEKARLLFLQAQQKSLLVDY